jgi:kynurenine formamidase
MNDTYRRWLDALAAERAGDRLGTAALIDDAGRVRAAAVVTGTPVSLARPLEEPGFEVEVSYTPGPIGMGADVVRLDCHGRSNTHVDALNHIALDDTWYGGWRVDDPAGPSVGDLARHGLVTRGVLVDIPAVRGTPWVDADDPVDGDDIDRALAATATTFERGDALLLYMGRDRFEAAGNRLTGLRDGSVVPGAGAGAAEWLVERGASILCWDFLDSNHPAGPFVPIHLLNWAVGLVLVDNCDLSAAGDHARRVGRPTGALVVAPLAIPGATGGLVHPLLLT